MAARSFFSFFLGAVGSPGRSISNVPGHCPAGLLGLLGRAAVCAAVLLGAACGSVIGDSCTSSSDCDPTGNRICDTTWPDGYCTVDGCTPGSCPDDGVCVRFFPGVSSQTSPSCAGPEDCRSDEICSLATADAPGFCAPRALERRFCMASCGSTNDCRGGYTCRTRALQLADGGEPVPDDENVSTPEQPFCAAGRICTSDADCAAGATCETGVTPGRCVQ